MYDKYMEDGFMSFCMLEEKQGDCDSWQNLSPIVEMCNTVHKVLLEEL